MSVINFVACKTCKVYLWAGQNGRAYTNADHAEALNEFLFIEHASRVDGTQHELMVVSEHHDDLIKGFLRIEL